ncbi:MAG: AbrB/MazE/SpoVT family DNA-binding domain-containing protein [Candidatus Woesearchaeota archaeon]|nr:AbrB/MazE/SpoVT family DNA-binding domain-containing protein [Candidatus Woesearchaeota archaeon]
MTIDISKVGERGQIVIPQDIRKKLHIQQGEKFLVISHDEDIIFRPLKKMESLQQIEEDIIDMRIAAQRWKEIEAEKTVASKEEFLQDLETW